MLDKITDKYIDGNTTKDFIDDDKIWHQINNAKNPKSSEIRAIIEKSLTKTRLDPEETAKLINVTDPELLSEMFKAAQMLKEKIYGKRIVFFAPLYVGNKCGNNCEYCGFRRDNKQITRKTLTMEQLHKEVEILENKGQKRLILVYGEHPDYDADFIAKTMKEVYSVKTDRGVIRRVNVNAAPFDVESYKTLKKAGIGTFQIFQETYHHETYKKIHPSGDRKSNYDWRLYGLDRAMAGGIDDIGIGALMGIYDWRFEVMGLLYHTIHLEETFNGVGPHTISFPRIESALGTPFTLNPKYKVSDEDFKKLVAIIRLSVPYTGMILTARETPEVRKEVIQVGISQIDAGSRVGVGGYEEYEHGSIPEKEQFQLGDMRSLDEVIQEVCCLGYIPSFCTADYRCGRTGEVFMGIAKPGLIHNYCMPNAMLTFKEYLLDYASKETKEIGNKTIEQHKLELAPERQKMVDGKLKQIENGERDIYI